MQVSELIARLEDFPFEDEVTVVDLHGDAYEVCDVGKDDEEYPNEVQLHVSVI